MSLPINKFRLISIALGLVGCTADSTDADPASAEAELARGRVYACSESDARGVAATLSFDRDDNLKKVVLARVPYRGFAASQTFDVEAGRKNTGRNSEQEFSHVTWDVPTNEGTLEAEISYLIKTKTGATWKSVSLDEALLGENRAVNGQPYGKLRVDVTIPWLDIEGDVGSTYSMSCKKR